MSIGSESFESLNDPTMWTWDDTIHPIQRIDNVLFGEEGNQTYIKNILHVPTIMKIVEQGMQVRFNDGGCFIEKEGRLIIHGRREC